MSGLNLRTVIVDKDNEHLLSANGWRLCRGYVQRNRPVKGGEIMLHRMILSCPAGHYVDHINGNKLDNRRENLRIVTPSQSIMNTGPCKGCSSSYKGVTWHKAIKKWQAKIGLKGGKSKYLGVYHSEISAALAYDRAAREHFKEFARPNFPEGGLE